MRCTRRDRSELLRIIRKFRALNYQLSRELGWKSPRVLRNAVNSASGRGFVLDTSRINPGIGSFCTLQSRDNLEDMRTNLVSPYVANLIIRWNSFHRIFFINFFNVVSKKFKENFLSYLQTNKINEIHISSFDQLYFVVYHFEYSNIISVFNFVTWIHVVYIYIYKFVTS